MNSISNQQSVKFKTNRQTENVHSAIVKEEYMQISLLITWGIKYPAKYLQIADFANVKFNSNRFSLSIYLPIYIYLSIYY